MTIKAGHSNNITLFYFGGLSNIGINIHSLETGASLNISQQANPAKTISFKLNGYSWAAFRSARHSRTFCTGTLLMLVLVIR